MIEEKKTDDRELLSTLTDDEIESIRSQAREKALTTKHTWKQRGNVIVCETCDYQHGFYVPPNHRLINIQDGKPIFKKLK